MRSSTSSCLVLLLLLAGLTAGPARAADGPAARCAVAALGDLSRLPDAPTQITYARTVDAAGGLPAYCEVGGYVSPNVGIGVRIPVAAWNGKILQVGCGGWCGIVFEEWFAHACDVPLQRGYACLRTDSGHKGQDLKWAYNNVQAEIDYGFRANHVALVAGKAIAERYAGTAPKKSYLMGCSGGGREGMVAAQRFPWDYDGIVSVAPAISVTGGVMRLLWSALATTDAAGQTVLDAAAIDLINAKAVASCDRDDGLEDGIIGHPQACEFDPVELQCGKGKTRNCLSAGQVAAARKIYEGPRTSAGQRLYNSGDVPGAELGWKAHRYWPAFAMWADLFRYMGFRPDPGPDWNVTDFDFDRDYRRLGQMSVLLDFTDPDLRRFKAAGGKLILAHGWADHLQSGLNSIDYYEMVEKAMDGRASTQEFFRLFMLPGVDHCSGGPGADAVDYLRYLEDWVERGRAPDRLISAKLKPEANKDRWGLAVPDGLRPESVEFTRPVYPYPIRVRYSGRGDPSDASSFVPVE